MKRKASRLRKGQASLERHCHISGIPITLSTPPPATMIKGSSGERTGRIKLLFTHVRKLNPSLQSITGNQNRSGLHLPSARKMPIICSPSSVCAVLSLFSLKLSEAENQCQSCQMTAFLLSIYC